MPIFASHSRRPVGQAEHDQEVGDAEVEQRRTNDPATSSRIAEDEEAEPAFDLSGRRAD
jgi:hypothetical protein